MKIQIDRKIHFGEFDYTVLVSLFSDYKNPRDQITKLLKEQQIVRIKKGLYIFGKVLPHAPLYSREVLANQIYGPSYISKEYALAYYGLIPEKVVNITAMTPKRNKRFSTPIGIFEYEYLSLKRYQAGITLVKIDQSRQVLMATKEKAIVDCIYKLKGLQSTSDLKIFLCDHLRIDEDELKKLNIKNLVKINQVFKNRVVKLLISLQKELA